MIQGTIKSKIFETVYLKDKEESIEDEERVQ